MKKGEVITCNNVSYSLIESIGNGGSGVVWRVKVNSEYYAIKFLDSTENDKIERFEKELKFCKENFHKNIISVIGEGEYKEKRYYIMPLYPKTLKKVIEKEEDPDILIKYILQLCNSIQIAHSKGVVHRDIKPENILIDGKKLVLADFGIAHFKDSSLTKHGDLLANRNYLAPEQKLKNNAKNIEKSADIYALGLIMNECFTKQNPAGSSFKIIANKYPLFFKLDTLVENMTKQNPNERFTIVDVIVELKFIYGKVKQDLQEIKEILLKNDYPNEISNKTLNKIIKRVSEDLLFANYIFKNKSLEEIRKYNNNWHMKIGYNVDKFLFNLYMQEMILEKCKDQFDRESCGYTDQQTYTPLDLTNNDEHKQIYKSFKEIVFRYPLNNQFEKNFDLSGKILKYFSSCEDYHCKSILDGINNCDFSHNAKYILENSPIISILSALKNTINVNIERLTDGYKSIFGGQYNFNFAEHISINWGRTIGYETNDDELELIDDRYIDTEKIVNEIMLEFQRQWKVVYNKIDEDYYSVKFKSFQQFDKFRKHAISVSKSPKSTGAIKGDVLDIFKHYNYASGIVEIVLSKVFDIQKPLAIVLGLRTDYSNN